MADFKNIPVDKDTTADEVLQRVLCKLGDEVNVRNPAMASSLMDSVWTELSICLNVFVYVLWLQVWYVIRLVETRICSLGLCLKHYIVSHAILRLDGLPEIWIFYKT